MSFEVGDWVSFNVTLEGTIKNIQDNGYLDIVIEDVLIKDVDRYEVNQ